VTDGQKNKVRMVVVKNGVVTENRKVFPKTLKVQGKVLIGRDRGARQLRQLKKGTPITVKARLTPRPKMAITGNVFLIRDGERKARDDREMHPRTAVGIDYDTGVIFLLVIDGRQDFSRGYTMVEMATLMEYLGADEALNLDGGGSSTMVARRPDGKVKVLNSPSDGHQRWVPNGLEVFYDPTAAPPVPTVP
jgi:exopolysaccharide biosynthesis protein